MVAINLSEMIESFKYYFWHFCCLGNSPFTLDKFVLCLDAIFWLRFIFKNKMNITNREGFSILFG